MSTQRNIKSKIIHLKGSETVRSTKKSYQGHTASYDADSLPFKVAEHSMCLAFESLEVLELLSMKIFFLFPNAMLVLKAGWSKAILSFGMQYDDSLQLLSHSCLMLEEAFGWQKAHGVQI